MGGIWALPPIPQVLDTSGNYVDFPRPTIGPFGTAQIAQRNSVLELKSNYGISALRDLTTTTGSATITNDKVEHNLSTGTTTGSKATLDSAERGRYMPGAEAQAGIGVRTPDSFSGTQEAKWGYFDDDDGFGFGVDATGIFVFTRRATTTTKVYQTNWNTDKLDGTGGSGLTLDLSRGNIFHIEFTWYGYGVIEYSVFLPDSSGRQVKAVLHRFAPSGETSVENPNLPLRAEIDNGGSTTDLSLHVGGRQFSVFVPFTPNRRVNGERRLSLGSVDTTFLPTVTFRKKTDFLGASVKIEGFDILTDADLVYELRLGGSLTGASFGTPTNTTASETACEADSSATAITGGEVVYSGFVDAAGPGQNNGSATRFIPLDIPSTEEVTLCVRRVSGTGATVSVVLRWAEEW